MSGLELIREIALSAPETERPQIVMMTAHATIESAIEAMKLGALDFLQKPFEIDELLVVASRAIEHQRLRGQHRYLINGAVVAATATVDKRLQFHGGAGLTWPQLVFLFWLELSIRRNNADLPVVF